MGHDNELEVHIRVVRDNTGNPQLEATQIGLVDIAEAGIEGMTPEDYLFLVISHCPKPLTMDDDLLEHAEKAIVACRNETIAQKVTRWINDEFRYSNPKTVRASEIRDRIYRALNEREREIEGAKRVIVKQR